MPVDVPQSEEARMSMLRECVLYVVQKATMLIDVQQSVRRLDPVIWYYTVSRVEKMDTWPVGVEKRMMINSRIKIPIALHSDDQDTSAK